MSWMDKVLEATSGGGGSSVTVESLSVTANGTYTAPTGKAYSPVDVSVENSYSAGDEGKVVKNGALAAQGSATYNSNGTYDTTEISSVEVSVSGGGSSRTVVGTFKGTTTGVSLDVTVPYTGSGYPIALQIFPSEGFQNNSGTFGQLVQKNAFGEMAFTKVDTSAAPDYADSSDKNKMTMLYRAKGSDSDATNYSTPSFYTSVFFADADAAAGGTKVLRIRNSTKFSVWIASSGLCCPANIEYTYIITYSS